MTDYEIVKALFNRREKVLKTDHYYQCAPEFDGDSITFNGGYSGFATTFGFDDEGNLTSVGAFE